MLKKLKYFLPLFAMVLILFGVSGCNQGVSLLKNQVSDIRYDYYEGETANWYFSFSSGLREEPYVLDGFSKSKVEFGIITISPKKGTVYKGLSYTVNIDGVEYSGDFERSPFNETFAGDIEKRAASGAEIFVTISDGGSTEIANLTCVTADFAIDSNDALELALAEAESELEVFCKKGSVEVYVKIVADISHTLADKFWIVLFLSESGEEISIIINPMTGKCEVKSIL